MIVTAERSKKYASGRLILRCNRLQPNGPSLPVSFLAIFFLPTSAMPGRCNDAVVDLSGFGHEDFTGQALMFLTAAAELLNALTGDTDQIAVVSVGIIRVAFKMGLNRLNTAVFIFR